MRSTATASATTPTDAARAARRRPCGATLFELLVVVAVLGLAASVAVPRAAPASVASADAVASAVAHAFRFAQRESLRTAAWHRVSIDTGTQVLRVVRLDISGTSVAEDTSHPVLHPLEKREYRIAFGDGALRAGVVSALFQYNSGASASYLSFGPDGAPGDIGGALVKTVDALKSDGQVTVRHGRIDRVVRIEAVTGRVTF